MKAAFAAIIATFALAASPLAAQAANSTTPAKPPMMSRLKAAAQTHKAPAAEPSVAAKNNGGAPRTAKSLACSAQADKQNVHGKARKSFMSHCKKA